MSTTFHQRLLPNIGKSIPVFKVFRPKRNPYMQIEIRPITRENMLETANNVASVFTKYEPLVCKAGVEKDYFCKNLVLPIVERCVRENLGIAAYDSMNDQWVGSAFGEDIFTKDEDHYGIDPDNKLGDVLKWMDILEQYEQKILGKPNRKFEHMRLVRFTVNPNYNSLGICQELIKFFMQDHPIVSKAEIIVSECTGVKSKKVVEGLGWKSIWEMPYADIAKMNKEYRSFNDLQEFMKKKGLDIAEKCYCMAYIR